MSRMLALQIINLQPIWVARGPIHVIRALIKVPRTLLRHILGLQLGTLGAEREWGYGEENY